jgi:hypothetical protein
MNQHNYVDGQLYGFSVLVTALLREEHVGNKYENK